MKASVRLDTAATASVMLMAAIPAAATSLSAKAVSVEVALIATLPEFTVAPWPI